MAVYLVEDQNGNQMLIEAKTKAGAINYIARNEYSANSLNTSELVQMIKKGLAVESVEDEDIQTSEEDAA